MSRPLKTSFKHRAAAEPRGESSGSRQDAQTPHARPAAASGDPLALHRALEQVTPMLNGISKAELLPIRLDIPTMATLLLKRLRAVEPYRDTIAMLPLVRQDWLANLEAIALALLHVDSLCKIVVKERPAVKETFAEASQLRDALRAPVAVLEKRGLLTNASLVKQAGRRGYLRTAQDLMVFGNALRDNWESIHGRTTITLEEVNRCTVLAQLLFRSAESRAKRAAIPANLILLKRQTYTLFLRAYDELRRCLDFIEPGAAKRIAPTLYQGRGPKPRAQSQYAGA